MRSVPPSAAVGVAQPAAGLPQLLDRPQRSAGVAADVVQRGLLAVELLDHHQRHDHVVLVEAEQRVGSASRTQVSRT
jgi:hypothetical protein